MGKRIFLLGAGGHVSIGSIADYDVVVEKYCQVSAGAICRAGSHIINERKIEAGEVVKGY